jgi:hypothetical protein
MANAPLAAGANPAAFSAVNQALGMGNLGAQTANIAPTLTQAGQTVSQQLAKTAASKAVPGLESAVKGYAASPEYLAQANMARDATTASKVADVYAAQQAAGSPVQAGMDALSNLGNLIQSPSMQGLKDYVKEHPYASAGIGYGAYNLMKPDFKPPKQDVGMIRPYKLDRGQRQEAYATSPLTDTSERLYFTDAFTPLEPYPADSEEAKKASGGIASAYAVGGPVEQMSAMNAVGGNTMYPQSQFQTPMYSNPMIQRPMPANVISQGLDAPVDPYSGEQRFAEGGEAKTEGGYKYSYDPKTQTFTQLSVPRIVPETNYLGQPFQYGPGSGTPREYVRYTGEGKPPGDDYQYVRGGMGGPEHYLVPASSQATPTNTGSKISGGIAAPVGGPSTIAPVTPAAPVATQPPIDIPAYQSPEERLGLTDFYAMMNQRLAAQGRYAKGGGVSDLGGYSDGGRLLRGPGDGVSDSIPAVIGKRQPARLADGEFVVPARIVSELGNGSTEAGARKLYAMMERIQKGRRKSVGKNKVAVDSKSDKHLPA